MASHKESSTEETDEPNPKVQKLNASASGADEPAGVELEDHSTEDLHIPQADISNGEEEFQSECPSCSVWKDENCQLKNLLHTSKEEIRRLKNTLRSTKENLKSRRKEQKNLRRKGIVQSIEYIQLDYKDYKVIDFL